MNKSESCVKDTGVKRQLDFDDEKKKKTRWEGTSEELL